MTTVVITRPAAAGNDWEQHFKQRGFKVVRFPTIRTVAAAPDTAAKKAIRSLNDFHWIVFTSPTGPAFFKKMLGQLGVKIAPRSMPSIAAIGAKTAAAARAAGIRVKFIPSRSDSAALAREINPVRVPILLVRADIASQDLPKALKKRGAKVADVAIYKTILISRPADKRFAKLLHASRLDYLTFASPSAVSGFLLRVKGAAAKKARSIPTIAIGPSVGRVLKGAGFKDVRIARENTARGIEAAMRIM